MIKIAFSSVFALLVFVVSGALVEVLKEGGAQPEGIRFASEYEGVLNYVNAVLKILAIALVAYSLIRRRFSGAHGDPSLFLLTLMAFLSALWAAYPYEAFSQALSVLLLILFAKSHVNVCGPSRVLQDFHVTFLVISGLSLFLVIAVPSYGISVGEHEGKWQGAFNHKNALGNFSAFAFLIILGMQGKVGRVSGTLSLIVSLTLLAFSQSYTSYGVALIGGLAFLCVRYFRWISRIRLLIVPGWMALSCATIVLSLYGAEMELFGKSSSFSGRDEIWATIVLKGMQSPVYGLGFSQLYAEVSSKVADYEMSSGFVVGTAHNGFLELFYSLGFLGVGLFLYYLIRLIAKAGLGMSAFAISVIVGFIVLNTFESRLFGWNFYFLILVYIEALTMIGRKENA